MLEKKEPFFDALIETPKGSRNKYEYDFVLRKARYDRMTFSLMMYPADYGFVPESLVLDSDPLDMSVLVTEPISPGCVTEVKPTGVFRIADGKGPDKKVVCVSVSDPAWNRMNDLSDLNSRLIKEIRHSFSIYKDLEKKKIATNGWGNVEEAVRIYRECKERYIGNCKNFSIN